jgi:sulfoxide reductase heme-binding subunit YedZ
MIARGGWPLVGLTAILVGTMVAAVLGIHGLNEDGVRASVRATARASLLLFLAAFTASSLRRLCPNALTAWLLRNRRYLGVSFATSHTVHGIAIVALSGITGSTTGVEVVIVGGIGYLFIAAMTVTSFDRTAAVLGRDRWRRLHVTGAYYLWLVFTFQYAAIAISGGDLVASFLTLLLLAAVTARVRRPPPRP